MAVRIAIPAALFRTRKRVIHKEEKSGREIENTYRMSSSAAKTQIHKLTVENSNPTSRG